MDKGQPRKRNGIPTKPSAKADLGTWQIPPDLDPKAVIEQYLTEATTSHIARKYGISRKAMVKWLRETVPAEWKQAQIVRAFCRKDDADESLEAAADPLSLARARELLRSGQWDLERLDAANYGPKQEITHQVTPIFSVTLLSAPSPDIPALPSPEDE